MSHAAAPTTGPSSRGRPNGRDARGTRDELGKEQDVPVSVIAGPRFVEEELGPGRSQEVARLCHRGEGHAGGCGQLYVVIADDGDVSRNGNAVLQQALHQAEGEEVVGAEHTGRALAPGQAEQPLAGCVGPRRSSVPTSRRT